MASVFWFWVGFKVGGNAHMFFAHEPCFDNFAGRVAEFDTPMRLLEDKSSMFFKLVTEYSSRSSGIPDF